MNKFMGLDFFWSPWVNRVSKKNSWEKLAIVVAWKRVPLTVFPVAAADLHRFFLTLMIFSSVVMEEDDDSDFNVIKPTLLQQLKTILDQYPDDGQILKVTLV